MLFRGSVCKRKSKLFHTRNTITSNPLNASMHCALLVPASLWPVTVSLAIDGNCPSVVPSLSESTQLIQPRLSFVNLFTSTATAGGSVGTGDAIAQVLQDGAHHRRSQRALAVATLQAQSAVKLTPFDGKGAITGTQALDWFKRTTRAFAAREELLQVDPASPEAQKARITSAISMLEGDALRWYESLPSDALPTWRIPQTVPSALQQHLREERPAGTTEDSRRRGGKDKDKLTLEGRSRSCRSFRRWRRKCRPGCSRALTQQAWPARPRAAEAGGRPGLGGHRKDPTREDVLPLHKVIERRC